MLNVIHMLIIYYVVISLLCNFCLFVPHIIIFQMISSILNCVYRYLINFDSFHLFIYFTYFTYFN